MFHLRFTRTLFKWGMMERGMGGGERTLTINFNKQWFVEDGYLKVGPRAPCSCSWFAQPKNPTKMTIVGHRILTVRPKDDSKRSKRSLRGYASRWVGTKRPFSLWWDFGNSVCSEQQGLGKVGLCMFVCFLISKHIDRIFEYHISIRIGNV